MAPDDIQIESNRDGKGYIGAYVSAQNKAHIAYLAKRREETITDTLNKMLERTHAIAPLLDIPEHECFVIMEKALEAYAQGLEAYAQGIKEHMATIDARLADLRTVKKQRQRHV